MLTSKVPIRDEMGRLLGIVGIGRDISDRMRAEKEIKRARDAAEAANRAKSDIPRQHEPRDPHADERRHRHDRAAARTRSSTPSSASTPRPSATAATRCSTIINDILDFSKIEAGKLELETLDVRPARRASRTSRDCWPSSAHGKGLELALLRRPGAAAGSASATRAACARCCSTCVGNAVKFTDAARSSIERRGRGARPDGMRRCCASTCATPASASRRSAQAGCSSPSPRPTPRPRALRRHRPRACRSASAWSS